MDPSAGPWDGVVAELHLLRRSAGEPSFAEIARRIADSRLAVGMNAHQARVSRSTVYSAFQPGRVRMNMPLVREIAEVLGAPSEVVDAWLILPPPSDPEPPSTPESNLLLRRPGPSSRQIIALMAACVCANLAGRTLVDFFDLPFHLDMIGTAIVAIALGPWLGALVGLSTNVFGVIGSGWISLPFALVNVAGALVWGYGVRRFRLGQSLPRFLCLNLLVAVTCTFVAVPIVVLFLGPDLRIIDDAVTASIGESIDVFLVAVAFSNILLSIVDKLLAGFIALVVVASLPGAFRAVDLVIAHQDYAAEPHRS